MVDHSSCSTFGASTDVSGYPLASEGLLTTSETRILTLNGLYVWPYAALQS
jgi:hypothetical protein